MHKSHRELKKKFHVLDRTWQVPAKPLIQEILLMIMPMILSDRTSLTTVHLSLYHMTRHTRLEMRPWLRGPRVLSHLHCPLTHQHRDSLLGCFNLTQSEAQKSREAKEQEIQKDDAIRALTVQSQRMRRENQPRTELRSRERKRPR